MNTIEYLKQEIKNAQAIAIFAGAGMSVDSGLEQFRGENGLWTEHITIQGKLINYKDLLTHAAFEETSYESWGLIGSLINKYQTTTPHNGYYKLFELIKEKE